MQYSTNSDESLRFSIRSQPTLTGQYRQAVLQIRDRLQALENYKFSVAKIEQALAISRIRLEQHRQNKPDSGAFGAIEIWQAEFNLQDIEIQEKSQGLKQGADLVEDAEREVEACKQEIERINREAHCDLGTLDSVAYQQLMIDDFRQRKSRAIAASLIAGNPAAIEMLMELPEGDRADYLERVTVLIGEVGAIKLDLATLQPKQPTQELNRSLKNGAS